ncbi:MAG: RHS repeat-associated core domain-containing protein [bacterium]|nr:RHS repeat-associated core domain-containing protein [bacterium]
MGKKNKRVMNMQRRPARKQQTQFQEEAQSTSESSGTENTTYYVHGPRGIHAQQQNDTWEWMIQDGLGSVRGVADTNANVHQINSYDPFGNPVDLVEPEQTVYGYTGEPTDENGLVYLRNRYYKPSFSTFISQDAFEGSANHPMSLNRYTYVHGNPVNNIDPNGLSPINISTLNHVIQDNPRAVAQIMNAGLCEFQQQLCPNPPFCTNTPQPPPTHTITPTPTGNSCVPTPTITPPTRTPSGTPTPPPSSTPGTPTPPPSNTPVPTPIQFNSAVIQGLSDADLELLAINIYYEARDYPEHWNAISNVWFNLLADPYATTSDVQRLLANNSAGWADFVRTFSRSSGTALDPLNLTAEDIQIIRNNFRGYSGSNTRTIVNSSRSGYPSPQYAGMISFYHTNADQVNEQVCQMECIVATPGEDIANNLRRRGALRIVTVSGSRTLVMNNGIFQPGPNLRSDSFCATCCRNNS